MSVSAQSSPWLKKLLIALSIVAPVGLISIYCLQNQEGIYDYEDSKDRAFILQLFKDNWEWLLPVSYPKDYPEFVLNTKSSSKDPKHFGNLIIKVYRTCDKPVGFVAYHKKKFFEGKILFLGVDAKERGKGHAQKLMNYAMEDLKNMGSTIILLVTRVANKSAQSLYRKLGFEDYSTDGFHLHFRKKV